MTSEAVEKILSPHTPEIRALAGELRALVREVAPQAVEKPQPGRRVFAFTYQGDVCGIQPQKAYVSFFFARGVELQHTHGILEGSGKNMRQVKVRPGAIPRSELRDYLRQAIAQNEASPRKARMAKNA